MLAAKLAQVGSRSFCPIAIVVRDGKVLKGHRHYDAKTWKDISVWTVPGGRCEEGETLEAALRRETFEETGIDDLDILDFIAEVPGAKEGDIVPIFYATSSQQPKLMEPEKFSEWRWIPLSDEYAEGAVASYNQNALNVVASYFRERGIV